MASTFNLMFNIMISGLLGCAFTIVFLFAKSMYRKSRVETIVNVSCNTGDAEGLQFTTNFFRGESEIDKAFKVREAYKFADERKEDLHSRMLKIREEAYIENQSKDPDTLKLRSVMEGKKK